MLTDESVLTVGACSVFVRDNPLVPYLPPSMTEGAIFLYETIDDARRQSQSGGSGFLVAVASEVDAKQVHLYAVSNDHVTRRGAVIRRRRADGDVEIIPGEPADWIEHPDGDDVAVRPLGPVPAVPESIRRAGIPSIDYHYFEAERLISLDDFQYGVGPSLGDECLMIGRYVTYDGDQFDRAALRFGNLAMFPQRVWQDKRAFNQESFLVDMRSLSGFSGSAVIVYFTEPGTLSMFSSGGPQMPFRTLVSQYWILGVDWGRLPVKQEIWEDGKSKQVMAESSMAGVVPAWKVAELLHHVEAVVTPRMQVEEELAQLTRGASSPGESLEQYRKLRQRVIAVPQDEARQQT
jgi:hypothetical protein